MSDNHSQLFSMISKCSKQSKKSLSVFFTQLLQPTEQKQHLSEKEQSLQKIFQNLTAGFTEVKAREISKNQRSERQLPYQQYNYGEIKFHTVYKLLQIIKENIRPLHQEEIFYDLGSGSGKVLLSAGICHNFKKCIGIQYLHSLYQTSCSLKNKVEQLIPDIQEQINALDQIKEEYRFPQIEVINADFKNVKWDEGTVIFVSSTCYTAEMMGQIEKISQELKQGTIMITLTRKLEQETKYWNLVKKVQGQTSWGCCNIFIQIKTS